MEQDFDARAPTLNELAAVKERELRQRAEMDYSQLWQQNGSSASVDMEKDYAVYAYILANNAAWQQLWGVLDAAFPDLELPDLPAPIAQPLPDPLPLGIAPETIEKVSQSAAIVEKVRGKLEAVAEARALGNATTIVNETWEEGA